MPTYTLSVSDFRHSPDPFTVSLVRETRFNFFQFQIHTSHSIRGILFASSVTDWITSAVYLLTQSYISSLGFKSVKAASRILRRNQVHCGRGNYAIRQPKKKKKKSCQSAAECAHKSMNLRAHVRSRECEYIMIYLSKTFQNRPVKSDTMLFSERESEWNKN